MRVTQPAVATDRSTGLLHAKPFVGSPMFPLLNSLMVLRSVARGVGPMHKTKKGRCTDAE
jgi:hypothetical protein